MLRSLPTRLSLLVLAACCVVLVVPAGAGAAVTQLSVFGGFDPAAGAGKLRTPRGLALNPAESELFVAELDSNRISVFTPAGDFLRAFGMDVGGSGVDVCTSFCQPGTSEFPAFWGAGGIFEPTDVAVDAADRVFVSDYGNARIDVFTPAGVFLYAFGKEVGLDGSDRCDPSSGCQSGIADPNLAGSLPQVEGIGISGSSLYAVESGANRVDVFSLDGSFLFGFGRDVNPGPGDPDVCTVNCQEGAADGAGSIENPTDVAVGPDGKLFVTYNSAKPGVAAFTSQGVFLGRFGDAGPGTLAGAAAVVTDASGAVHVADEQAKQVKTFSSSGTFVSAFAAVNPIGLVRDCHGAFYVSDYDGSPESSKVRRYGEPGTPPPPCSAPVVPISTVPSNKFKFGKLKLNQAKGTATLTVNVPGPGKLVLKGNGLKKVTKSAKKAGNVKLAVKATGKALKKLNEKGKAALKAKLTFTPTGGTALTKPRTLVLKKTLPS